MNLLSPLAVALGLSIASTAWCGAQDLGEAKYFGTSKVHRYQLSNGLKLLVLEDHSAPTFAYQTWFNVGSRDEVPGLTGLAHLFEHMMFKATTRHPEGELDRLLEAAGAEGENAFTSKDYTAYVQSLPRKKLDLIASLESDRMVNLVVNDASLDKEREVVQNERRFRTENSPDGSLYEKLYEIAYTKHSYRWPVIGYDQDLKNAKSKQCADFYKAHYAPNNATVIVVGDVDAAHVASVVSSYYGSLPPSELKASKPELDSLRSKEKTDTLHLNMPVEKVYIGYRIPDAKQKDYPAIEVLRNILAVGKSSRLYRRLVDGEVATSVEISNSEQKDQGIFILMASLQKGKTGHQAVSLIEKELGKIAKTGVSASEVETANAQYRFALFNEQVSNSKKAEFLGYYETVMGDFGRGIELVDSIKSVTPADVKRVAKEYFVREARAVVFGIPAKSAGGAE